MLEYNLANILAVNEILVAFDNEESMYEFEYDEFLRKTDVWYKKFDKCKLGKVIKSDVVELCPSLSISAIEKAIAKMVEEGKLVKMGSGKTTYYVIKL